MKTCLALIRDGRGLGHKDAGRSQRLYEDVLIPAASQFDLECERVDPHDYGLEDARLFNKIDAADIMVVDLSAESMDYMYSLGVRHALSDKPTILLVEETRPRPADLSIPREFIHYPREVCPYAVHRLRERLTEELKVALSTDRSEPRYSPVQQAFEARPRLFLSYAHADSESVLAVDQWLRDRGARVDIDERNFVAGRDIRDEIVRVVSNAGKVVCFYSKHSSDRYYPKLERRLVEEAERKMQDTGEKKTVLVYFRLDDTPLPRDSSHRLAINACTRSFENACTELWRNLLERAAEPRRVPLSRYRTSAPWEKA